MSQAKVLTDREIRKVLLYIAANRHASRNRAMFLLTHLSGMRVGEVASLRLCDVLSADGQVRDEIRLAAAQTKGDKGRVVLLPKRAQEEIYNYLIGRFRLRDLRPLLMTDTTRALFASQKHPNRGFTANTLAQTFHYIYEGAGVAGASSHSGRRGFITSLAHKGVSAKVLMELAGHKSLAVTQKYIDVNPAMLRAAVELV